MSMRKLSEWYQLPYWTPLLALVYRMLLNSFVQQQQKNQINIFMRWCDKLLFSTNYENVRNMQHLGVVFPIHQLITVNQNEKGQAGAEWHHHGAKCFPSMAAFVGCAPSAHVYP